VDTQRKDPQMNMSRFFLFFSFLLTHPFGFSGRYSRDMLEHHTRLNLKLLFLFLFFKKKKMCVSFYFFCWNSRYLCPCMELQESMPQPCT
jgi:hypothetical protein